MRIELSPLPDCGLCIRLSVTIRPIEYSACLYFGLTLVKYSKRQLPLLTKDQTKVLNLVCEPEKWNGSDDDLTTEQENGIGDDSLQRDYN